MTAERAGTVHRRAKRQNDRIRYHVARGLRLDSAFLAEGRAIENELNRWRAAIERASNDALHLTLAGERYRFMRRMRAAYRTWISSPANYAPLAEAAMALVGIATLAGTRGLVETGARMAPDPPRQFQLRHEDWDAVRSLIFSDRFLRQHDYRRWRSDKRRRDEFLADTMCEIGSRLGDGGGAVLEVARAAAEAVKKRYQRRFANADPVDLALRESDGIDISAAVFAKCPIGT